MEKCNEIKMEYGRLRQEIQNVLAGKLSDEELLRYFMATALKIWSGNVLYAPAYSELLSAVSGQSYTIEQIMSALGCCGAQTARSAVLSGACRAGRGERQQPCFQCPADAQ